MNTNTTRYTEKNNAARYLERASYSWSDDSIRHINTPTPTARSTFFYVQEVGYFRTQPPYFTERSNLSSFLIFYTISGEGSLTYHDQIYRLTPGSLAFINCMDYHYYECPRDQNWEFLWLHFNGATSRGYYEEYIKNGFSILNELDEFFVERTLRRILALTQKKDLHSEILISSLIMELLTQLLIAKSTENLGLGFMPPVVRDTLKIIENRFHEPLSLDTFAAELGISKYHLSREFTRYIGTSIGEYIIVTRINHAKELLKYSAASVEEIAFSCGFHNVSHFIKLFKKHEAITPLQFRKEWCEGI